MKSITHTERMSQPLRIETQGCIITIYANLTIYGQPVTIVQVHCNDNGPVDTWRTENGKKFANLRVIKQAGIVPK